MLQTRLPFQFPLYVAVFCCIPSKSPAERWGSHSCSSSEIQNVIPAVGPSPAKQHSLSPEHSIAVPGARLHKAFFSAQQCPSHGTQSVSYPCTAHIHPSVTQEVSSCHTAQPTAALCSWMEIADTRLRWLQQCLVIHCKSCTLLFQFHSYSLPPPPPDQPALRNGLCDWQIKHYY